MVSVHELETCFVATPINKANRWDHFRAEGRDRWLQFRNDDCFRGDRVPASGTQAPRYDFTLPVMLAAVSIVVVIAVVAVAVVVGRFQYVVVDGAQQELMEVCPPASPPPCVFYTYHYCSPRRI